MIARFALFLVCLMLALPAYADDYAAAQIDNIAKTLVRFGALDISDDALLDEYAMVTDCDLYKRFYGNDFQWNKVRGLIRNSIQMNIASFPISYHYDARLQLDRYDFAQKTFMFTALTTIHNINTFVIYHREDAGCGQAKVQFLPTTYRSVMDTPLTIPGIPLAEADAQAMLKQMDADKNDDRIVFTRFNLRIIYVDPLRKASLGDNAPPQYMQAGHATSHGMRFDARLDSVDFYEDPAMKRLIYSYRP